MAFISILFGEKEQQIYNKTKLKDIKIEDKDKEPEYFKDLSLDHFVAELLKHKDKYNLKEYLFNPLSDRYTIYFRQEVMQDLEGNDELFEKIKDFAHIIFDAVNNVENAIKYLKETEEKGKNYLEKGRFLNSFIVYYSNIEIFEKSLQKFELKSKGLIEFKTYISDYVNSSNFKNLLSEAQALQEELTKLKYSMLIKENCIKVRKYEKE